MTLSHYTDARKSGEDFMLRRLYIYTTEAEYTRYTNTKEEEWRMTLREPARALIEYLESHSDHIPGHGRARHRSGSAEADGPAVGVHVKEEKKPTAELGKSSGTVLVIEDEEMVMDVCREILDAGAQGFIQKPFSIETLSEKLKEVLEK